VVELSEPPEQRAAIELLARATVLMLEGSPRPDGRTAPPLRAPVPPHARPVLDRLLAVSPVFPDDVRRFRDELAETADLPREIAGPRRAAQIGMMAVLHGMGGMMFMLPAVILVTLLPIFLGRMKLLVEDSMAVHSTEAGSARELAAGLVTQPGWGQLGPLALYANDNQLLGRLRTHMEAERRDLDARLQAADPATQAYLKMTQAYLKMIEQQNQTYALANIRDPNYRYHLQRAVEEYEEGDHEEFTKAVRLGGLIAAVVGATGLPAIWIIWAFLFRGGISYYVMGIRMVRTNGRPAWRVQCLWRALLVWAPIALLLVGSVLLQDRYWSSWTPADPERWLIWTAWGLMWLVPVVLLLYVVLALRSPNRALHDKLSGVYLVPA
jgi:hypothetical protein